MITEIDLFNKEPVRVNCRFTPKAAEILHKYHKYYKFSTNRLFELILNKDSIVQEAKRNLNNINDINKGDSARKTIALSKAIVDHLYRIARREGVKRDVIVNNLLEVFGDWATEQENEKRRRLIALNKIINELGADIDHIFTRTKGEIKAHLPKDDFFIDDFENIRMAYNKAFSGFYSAYFSGDPFVLVYQNIKEINNG